MSLQQILDWFEPLNIHNWYVLAAFVLAFALQIAKKTPCAKRIWCWLPKQWRWIWTALAGFAMGFVLGYQQGLPLVGAILAGIGGAFGVGMLGAGINDWLEKSVLPWPGSPATERAPNTLNGPEKRKDERKEPDEDVPPTEKPA